MNVGSGICKVLYDNGKSETVNLFKESHKVNGGGNGNELIERVLADYEEVSMLLGRIGVVLRDVYQEQFSCWKLGGKLPYLRRNISHLGKQEKEQGRV